MNRPELPLLNGLSVDVEDWFQVGAFERVIDPADWDSLPSRVEDNCARILDLFAQAGVSATFFTLGWIAHRHPHLIRRIHEAGHEVASHGMAHARVFTLGPRGFSADLREATRILEDAASTPIRGYRAPSFSIDARTPWAFEILAAHGFAWSSSVAPVVHDHYGWREAPRFAFRPLVGHDFVEVPVTTAEWAGRRFAAGGGGFFRVLPYAFSAAAIRQVNSRERRPAVFYFHPWEIDPGQPRIAAPLRSRLRHYSRLGAMEGKLGRLLRDFRWGRMDAVAAAEARQADFLTLMIEPQAHAT